MEKEIIDMKIDIYEENQKLGEKIRAGLSKRKILSVNILGSAGAGKTSTLVRVIERLRGIPVTVIEGDLETDIDTRKLQSLGIDAYQINTNGICHLDSPMIEAILRKKDIPDGAILFVENIGNLVCPADFDIGEHVRIVISSVPEGSDKPYKYPVIFQHASAVVLNKSDLAPYIDFDLPYFVEGVKVMCPGSPLFEVSAKNDAGFDALAEWIIAERERILQI
ncbi:MAG: hydrogenase nickel incorporation protein HypB [Brevinematales bacterium]|nr:hydrogenase nickel incorporation protein HypB [Brevinematales bacterium]